MTRRRWLPVVTGFVGVLVALVVVLTARAALGLLPYGESDPGSAHWSCDGTAIVATAAVDDGIVIVQVTIRDTGPDAWRVRWDPSYAPVTEVRGDGGGYPSAAAPTGDLDNGPSRDVEVQRVGSDTWCAGTVSLT